MSGETPLIIRDLQIGLSIKEISIKYQKSESNIRAIARRHNIVIKKPKLTEEERKNKKRLADRERYNSRERMGRDIDMPILPFQAAKFGSLGKLTEAWALKDATHRGKKNDIAAQIRYGLNTRVIGK